MGDTRGHSHTINNLQCEGETGGERVRQAGKRGEKHVDSTADRERGRRLKKRKSYRMRRCLLFTRRLIEKTLEKLGEIPEKKNGIHWIIMLDFLLYCLNKDTTNYT